MNRETLVCESVLVETRDSRSPCAAEASPSALRVLILSPTRLFGESLARCLSRLEMVAEARFCHGDAAAVYHALALQPQILLVDEMQQLGASSLRAVRQACPTTRWIALCVADETDALIACADAGFDGILQKNSSLDDVSSAMLHALRSEAPCTPAIAPGLLRALRQGVTERAEGLSSTFSSSLPSELLTSRELEIMTLVGRAYSNKQVAAELALSVATVKNHLHNAFRKLGVRRRTEALACIHKARPSLSSIGGSSIGPAALGSGHARSTSYAADEHFGGD